jgi:hypothetical protein
MSDSEQATRKYSCAKRNTRPRSVESSGYSTRLRFSARSAGAGATKSPLLNSLKSNDSGALRAHSRSVLIVLPP